MSCQSFFHGVSCHRQNLSLLEANASFEEEEFAYYVQAYDEKMNPSVLKWVSHATAPLLSTNVAVKSHIFTCKQHPHM